MNFNPNQNWNFQPINNGFSRAPYRQNQGSQRQKRKRSGATAGTTKTGKPYVRGWKATKMGVVSIIAGPYVAENSQTRDLKPSKTGRIWQNWAAKVSAPFQPPVIVGALYDTSNGKVRIPSMGIVISPRANNGGYMGKPMSKNMRRY